MAYTYDRLLKTLLSALDAENDRQFTRSLRLFLLKHGSSAWRSATSAHPLGDELNDHAHACMNAHFQKSRGYLYVAANPMLEGFVKVGTTTLPPNKRMKSLTSAGVVGEFFLLKSWFVHDRFAIEALAHRHLAGPLRHKEFFKVHWEVAFTAVEQAISDYGIKMDAFLPCSLDASVTEAVA